MSDGGRVGLAVNSFHGDLIRVLGSGNICITATTDRDTASLKRRVDDTFTTRLTDRSTFSWRKPSDICVALSMVPSSLPSHLAPVTHISEAAATLVYATCSFLLFHRGESSPRIHAYLRLGSTEVLIGAARMIVYCVRIFSYTSP